MACWLTERRREDELLGVEAAEDVRDHVVVVAVGLNLQWRELAVVLFDPATFPEMKVYAFHRPLVSFRGWRLFCGRVV